MGIRGRTIIIVDDSEAVRGKLTELYESVGLRVIGEAEDGLKALELIKEAKPDIVSLDIIMPNMDGIECFLKLHGERPDEEDISVEDYVKLNPPCIFMTCLATENKVVEAYRAQIPEVAFLAKYPSEEVLTDRLSEILGLETSETRHINPDEDPDQAASDASSPSPP